MTPAWNTDFAIKCRRKFRRKFSDERVPNRQTMYSLLNKFRTTWLLVHRKKKRKRRVLTEEKLDDIGARLEPTPTKSLKLLAQETGVSKSSARTATQLLKPSSESWCLVCCKRKKDCRTCAFNETINCENIYVLMGQHLQHLLWSVNCNYYVYSKHYRPWGMLIHWQNLHAPRSMRRLGRREAQSRVLKWVKKTLYIKMNSLY
jgi:hypothetical protein